MFRWICLGVAVVFLTAVGWMINDMRIRVHKTSEVVRTAATAINQHLPAIVARSEKTTTVVSENLPEIVERVKTTTEVVAELAEDIRQLKELAGITSTARDRSLVAYADSVLKQIESSGGVIGVRKLVGEGLKNTRPAKEWAVSARKEALILTILVRSKKEMLTRLAKTKLGANWYIERQGMKPVPLLDWLKESHPESRDLSAISRPDPRWIGARNDRQGMLSDAARRG